MRPGARTREKHPYKSCGVSPGRHPPSHDKRPYMSRQTAKLRMCTDNIDQELVLRRAILEALDLNSTPALCKVYEEIALCAGPVVLGLV